MIDVCEDCGAVESFQMQTIYSNVLGDEPITEMTCTKCGAPEHQRRCYAEEDCHLEDHDE